MRLIKILDTTFFMTLDLDKTLWPNYNTCPLEKLCDAEWVEQVRELHTHIEEAHFGADVAKAFQVTALRLFGTAEDFADDLLLTRISNDWLPSKLMRQICMNSKDFAKELAKRFPKVSLEKLEQKSPLCQFAKAIPDPEQGNPTLDEEIQIKEAKRYCKKFLKFLKKKRKKALTFSSFF